MIALRRLSCAAGALLPLSAIAADRHLLGQAKSEEIKDRMGKLKGRRILIVEDEVLIGLMASEMLEDLGATVIGPALNVPDGIALAEQEQIDAALIDINLGGTRSDAVVDVLARRGIPVLYTTGYSRSAASLDKSAVLEKPYSADALAGALVAVLERGS